MLLRTTVMFLIVYSHLHGSKIDFNRQIRPILSDKCFKCHGPDAKNQKSDFRLDTFEHAIQEHNGLLVLPRAAWKIRKFTGEYIAMMRSN